MGKIIDAAVDYAIRIANNNKHGYDQYGRWGPDYDCSSLIISAWNDGAGIPVKAAGASYTGNMKNAFVKCGFKAIEARQSLPLILKGDVLLNEKHHTCMAIGGGQIVQASISENGTITGRDGDQTGREIATAPLYVPKYKWDYVLRYPEKEEEETVDVNMPVLRKGSRCAEVGTVQTLFNALGYTGKNGRPLTVDHDFGDNVEYATKNFQKDCGLNPDGVIGLKSWPLLLKANY